MAHVREECGPRAGNALGEVAGLPHDPFGALGRLFADREARRHAEVIHQCDVRAPGHDRHSQGEQAHDDRGREMMALLAHRQRDEDGEGDAREEAADAQRIRRERRQRTGDQAGEDDEEERGGLEGYDRQHQCAAHPPGDGKQGHRSAHASTDHALGQPTA